MDNITERLNGIEEAIKNLNSGSKLKITDWIDATVHEIQENSGCMDLNFLASQAGLNIEDITIINIKLKNKEDNMGILTGLSDTILSYHVVVGEGDIFYKLIYMEEN